MTREMAEKYIRWSMAGNSEDRFRPNEHLHLVLRLMYYSHVKPVYIYRLKPYEISTKRGGCGEGCITKESGECVGFIQIRKEEMELLNAYIEKYNIKRYKPVIQVGERAIRKVFTHIVDVYRIPGEKKPRLIDVYFAGIGKE